MKDPAHNIASLLDHAAASSPSACFLSVGEHSYADVASRAEAFTEGLLRNGVGFGDRVGLRFANGSLVVEALLGAWKAGAIPVMIGSAAPPPEISREVDSADLRAMVSPPDLFDSAADGVRQSTSRPTLLRYSADGLVNPGGDSGRHETDATRNPTAAVAADHPAIVLFTSGTTGRPKGAVLTHANLRQLAKCVVDDFFGVGPDDTLLMAASNAHIFGITLIMAAMRAGGRLHLLEKFDPRAFMTAIEHGKVTFTAGVPQMAQVLLSPIADDFDLSSFRRIMLGGDTVSPELIAQLETRLGLEVVVGLGMTEAAPVAHTTLGGRAPRDSVGRPASGIEIRIVGPDGGEAPTGVSGEMEIRGLQVFPGYLDAEADATTWNDGWFRTGDLGTIDANGFIYHVDRLKNVIKAGGYSVFPAEVERVLRTHPGVLDAAVVSRSHKKLGEVVQALVVRNPDVEVSNRDLIRYAKSQLAAYKAPRSITFVDALPRNAIGKVDRAALSEAAAPPE